MSEFVTDSLNRVASITMGQSPDSKMVNDKGNGLPFFQGNADFGKKSPIAKEWCTQPKKIASAGDILISVRAPVGEINLANTKSCIGRGLSAITAKTISRDYLYYYLTNFSYELTKREQGSTFKAINRGDLDWFKVKFPKKINKQNKIADILLTVDACITQTEETISKLQKIKAGLMQDLFDEKKYCDWNTTTLESVRNNTPYSFTGGPFGSDLKNEDYVENHGIRVIQLQNIGDGEFISVNKIFTSIRKADELKKCNVFPGDIIVAKMADPLARACIIPDDHDRYLMCSDGIRLSVNSFKYDSYFIMNLINHYLFRKKAERIGTGTTRLRIGLTDLKNITFKCPDLETQKIISKKVNNISNTILYEKNVLNKYLKIKQGLMQDLLTGKVEVRVGKDD